MPMHDHNSKRRGENNDERKGRIQVVVLGDIGRSPRIQYHALSAAKHGAPVDLIGYAESGLPTSICANPLIRVHRIQPAPAFLQTNSKGLSLVFKPLKVLFQILSLWVVLQYRTKPAKWIIVQNPPSMPTVLVAQICAFLRNSRLVVDWHNFESSILALQLGGGHPLVRLSRLCERTLSRSAFAHFTVTDAMAQVLQRDYGLSNNVLPLHDRPASYFRPVTRETKLAILRSLSETANFADSIEAGKSSLLVSSTSWTPDEDFGVLLDALVQYSHLAMTSHPYLPEVLVVVTGKGPLKDHFLAQIAMLKSQDKLEMITFKTAWLSLEDYAGLLAAADVGVSLHKSTSGVDLPMKVVDMFGAGLPVVGWSDFEAWAELVKEGVNGRGFKTAAELQSILMELLSGQGNELQTLKEGAIREGSRRWGDEWDPIAAASPCKIKLIMLTFQSVTLGAVLISHALTIPLTTTNPDNSNNLPRDASPDIGSSDILNARKLELIARGGSGSVTVTPTEYDNEYLVPVQIGPAKTAKTYQLVLDTGTSALIAYSTGPSQTVSEPVTIGGITVPSQTVQFQPSNDPSSDGILGLAFSNPTNKIPPPPKTFFENAAPSLIQSLFTVNLKKGAPGTLTFGTIDTSQYTGSITYATVNPANGYWEFTPSGYAIGSSAFVATSSIDALVDTGTTLLYLPKTIVSAYYAKVPGAKFDSTQGGYTFPCSATLPSFTLGVGAYRAVAPGSFLNYAPVSGATCFGGLQADTGIGFSVLGSVFLKSQFVVFKGPASPMVGFAAKTL
ncbi:MAG: hypothetical protein Q9195_006957 [Heterodermia aff. obscurata]